MWRRFPKPGICLEPAQLGRIDSQRDCLPFILPIGAAAGKLVSVWAYRQWLSLHFYPFGWGGSTNTENFTAEKDKDRGNHWQVSTVLTSENWDLIRRIPQQLLDETLKLFFGTRLIPGSPSKSAVYKPNKFVPFWGLKYGCSASLWCNVENLLSSEVS